MALIVLFKSVWSKTVLPPSGAGIRWTKNISRQNPRTNEANERQTSLAWTNWVETNAYGTAPGGSKNSLFVVKSPPRRAFSPLLTFVWRKIHAEHLITNSSKRGAEDALLYSILLCMMKAFGGILCPKIAWNAWYLPLRAHHPILPIIKMQCLNNFTKQQNCRIIWQRNKIAGFNRVLVLSLAGPVYILLFCSCCSCN